ncbi:MAG: ABC transporter permease, partial [Acidimicrobiia bacterium]
MTATSDSATASPPTLDDDATAAGAAPSPTALQRFRRRFWRQRLGVLAGIVLAILTAVAILGPWLSPHDPNAQDLRAVLQAPGGRHWLGTDELGRDVLSRLIAGSRVSLVAAVEATAVALAIGVPVGLVSGYAGGRIDRLVMVVNDAFMALPALILAIAIVGVLGSGLRNAMLAVGIVFTPRVLRLVRASVIDVRQETYVEAARSIGTSSVSILRRHILPIILSPLIVATSLMIARAMLAEAGLSFLGLGVQPPEASWGAMLG